MHKMAWEQRGNRRYYYRAYKTKGRVRKAYLGNGPLAELAAQRDDLVRQPGRDAAEFRRHELAGMQAFDDSAAAFHHTLETLTRATLVTAGYHRHHGSEWRKRRDA